MRTLETAEPYKVFVWERGAGETPACGSAACAIASALLSTNVVPRSSWVPTLFPGGWLFAKQDSQVEDVFLCGPGEFVFSGKMEI
jgi:diaminopimelate epimerase